MENTFKYIDLFSGIGGFHIAMQQLGGKCVFASEIDKYCNATYEENFHMSSDINIRDVKEEDIPEHDVLCGGFPCQAFSKAGKQSGWADKTRGTLFFEIARILKYHHTKYIVLENVRNLVSHDHGNTWKVIRQTLTDLGYRLTKDPLIVSPHEFGIPQLRERVVILGVYDPEHVDEPLNIDFGKTLTKNENSIFSILNKGKVDKKYYISEHEEMVLNAWDEFYKGINLSVIGFPIWAPYFRCTTIPEEFPDWKKEFVEKNIQLYKSNQAFIDGWLTKYDNLNDFTATQKKMEWQAGTEIKSLWDGVIQFRPSGIRVKAPTCFPALVAIVQVPIIGKYKRRMTVEEAAALQSFPADFICNSNDQQAYKQFGNSVNIEVIKKCAQKLLEYRW
jgi:DNA (cytosine-5)-methyltransferase 1